MTLATRIHGAAFRQFSRLVLPFGVCPTPASSAEAVRALIARVHPIVPEKGLSRIGPAGDGGYLLPDDLDGVEACFSPGVSTQSGFEKECADRGMRVYLADRSVEGPPLDHPLFHFTSTFIGPAPVEGFTTLTQLGRL